MSRLVKYDVIALQETKAKKDSANVLNSGEFLILGKKVEGKNIGGVGFLVNTSVAHMVDSYEILSPRLATLRLKVPGRFSIVVISCYAPTSAADETERESFYQELEALLKKEKSFYKFVLGDFNAVIGEGGCGRVGKHGLGNRNDNGDRLEELLWSAKLTHGNSKFEKKRDRRWTWRSPQGYTSEIDHVLTNRSWALLDVSVLPSFITGSDHRLVRAKIKLSHYLAKRTMYRPAQERRPTYDPEGIQQALSRYMWSELDDPNMKYNGIVEGILSCASKNIVPKPPKQDRLSDATKELLRKRIGIKCDPISTELERVAIDRKCRAQVRSDINEYRRSRLVKAAESRQSIKRCRRDMAGERQILSALKDRTGGRVTSRQQIENVVQDFYTDLYKCQSTASPNIGCSDSELPPCIIASEVRSAIKAMKGDTACGPDKISVDMLQAGGAVMHTMLATLFTEYLQTKKVPDQWRTSRTVLLHKKGDKEDIGNYRPISLLSVLYKTFSKIILSRVERQLDDFQPPEQAGFRKGFSVNDHIHTLSQLIERCREYRMPLVLVFVDYAKAFDSIDQGAVVQSLLDAGIHSHYVETIKDCLSNNSTTIRLFEKNLEIPIHRGVRQGDTISPKLFTTALQNAMRTLDWDNRGIKIDGSYLSNLRFADDIVLCANTTVEAEAMLIELDAVGKSIGLTMNRKKTQCMRNTWAPTGNVSLEGIAIEDVHSYVYLGRQINMTNDLRHEIARRRKAAWCAYGNIKEVTSELTDRKIRANLFDTTVLPALCYATETWATTVSAEKAIQTTHRALERALLGTNRWLQRATGKTSVQLRKLSQIRDPLESTESARLKWAGKVARQTDKRWTLRLTEWIPRDLKRPLGRPATRWSDSIENKVKSYNNATITQATSRANRRKRQHWMTLARESTEWKLVAKHKSQ